MNSTFSSMSFKELYKENFETLGDKEAPTEEGKIRALFDLFDAQSRRKIAKADFVLAIAKSKPAAGIFERLGNKLRKGGDRLLRAMNEEL